MEISCVLVACNDNTSYLDFWPAVKRSWKDVAGLRCLMVFVGEDLPRHLHGDPDVVFFKALPGWPTATQAQCIRLLYPAIIECSGAVMISDMDMVPLQSRFFQHGFQQFGDNQFVCLRGIDEILRQIYMCYVGAFPKVWSELFQVRTLDDIIALLKQWIVQYPSDGHHGGVGWDFDQRELYSAVKGLQRIEPDRVGCLPCIGIPRLDRSNFYDWKELPESLLSSIASGHFVDFHMPDYQQSSRVIHGVMDLFRKEAEK